VSLKFKKASAAELKRLQERTFHDEDIIALFLDGKTFADTTMVVALGITMTGEKRFLGFVETGTENAKVLTPFLRSLTDRGLDISKGILVVVDGAKGLKSAVKK
jgi:transposase-like protein